MQSAIEDPHKSKYFDSKLMSEIYFERCSDILMAKVLKVSQKPDWADQLTPAVKVQKIYQTPIINLAKT